MTQPVPEPGAALIRGAGYDLTVGPLGGGATPDALREALSAGYDGVYCLLTDTVDAAALDAAGPGCRVVSNMAVGFNNVDVAAATARKVLVTNTPGVLTDCTADLTWTLILGVARRAAEGDREMRAGRFRGWGPSYMLGLEVTGKTLGLVGPGRIATAVAERARGFRMPLLYHGRRPSPELDALGARGVALDELLAASDFVSLHVPLSDQTRHLIDAGALGRMKPTSYLINTSRGPVVDELALVEALKDGRIAGAGLDVYEAEPKMAAGLAELDNTVLLPHLGSATVETRAAMSRIAAENLIAALRGEAPAHMVNPEVRGTAT